MGNLRSVTQAVMHVAAGSGVEVVWARTAAEVMAADELMLSSATKELLPVTTLDGEPVGHGAGRGKPGPAYARLYEAYQRAKAAQLL